MQPSELAKPALVIFLAFFVTWRARAINNPRYTLVPAAMAVGLVILAVVVADLGTAVVLGAAAAVVFFVAGLEIRYCAIVGALALIGLVFFVFSKTYRLARVVKFFDPQFKIIEKFDPAGPHQDAPAEVADHARYQLPVGAIQDRRRRRRPRGSRPHERPSEAALSCPKRTRTSFMPWPARSWA